MSRTAEVISSILSDQYGYSSVTILKVSELIRANSEKVGIQSFSENPTERIRELQDAGTRLRAKYGDQYLAAKAIEEISISRLDQGGYQEGKGPSVPKKLRRATIIDSLKHQKESDILRETYGGIYWQFTVFAPETVRRKRLERVGVGSHELPRIVSKDENDKDGHGQKVAKTAHRSDFFVRNDAENLVDLKASVERFFEIIFGIAIHTPNREESGMYSAISAASKSACLSRQVGASIYSKSGELLGVGWNDVPRHNGGLYTDDAGKNDHRCFKWQSCECHNDRRKAKLFDEILNVLSNTDGIEGVEEARDAAIYALKQTPLNDLIEYSRAIHAEMEAILSVARSGKYNLVGSTLYTTTFPCHNCARHIVASGISEVIYIEPYSKSLALELHDDAIALERCTGKVAFLQYQGVAPRVSMKLFQLHEERKLNGKAISRDKKTAMPVLPPPMDGFTTHEKRVTTKLEELEKGV